MAPLYLDLHCCCNKCRFMVTQLEHTGPRKHMPPAASCMTLRRCRTNPCGDKMSLDPVAGRDEMAGVGKNRGTLSQKLNINQQAWFSKIQPKDVIRSQTNIMGSHIIPSVDKGMGYRSLTAKAVHTLILWLGELRVYLSQYVRCLVYHCTCNMRDGKTYMHIYIYIVYIYAFNCFLLCHKSQSSHDPKQANRKASHESFAMRKSRWKILVHGILFPYFQRPINYFPRSNAS